MGQVCLISGPPGCGKTTWVLQRLQPHQGPCAYLRLDVNRLFTARCRRQFRLELSGGSIQSHVKDHAGEQQSEQAVPKRSVIGIGGGSITPSTTPPRITSSFELQENLPTLRGGALADSHVSRCLVAKTAV